MLASRLFTTALQSCKNCQVQRSFHTTPTNKAIPPILVLFAKPLSRVAAALVGRSARAWWRRGDLRVVVFFYLERFNVSDSIITQTMCTYLA